MNFPLIIDKYVINDIYDFIGYIYRLNFIDDFTISIDEDVNITNTTKDVIIEINGYNYNSKIPIFYGAKSLIVKRLSAGGVIVNNNTSLVTNINTYNQLQQGGKCYPPIINSNCVEVSDFPQSYFEEFNIHLTLHCNFKLQYTIDKQIVKNWIDTYLNVNPNRYKLNSYNNVVLDDKYNVTSKPITQFISNSVVVTDCIRSDVPVEIPNKKILLPDLDYKFLLKNDYLYYKYLQYVENGPHKCGSNVLLDSSIDNPNIIPNKYNIYNIDYDRIRPILSYNRVNDTITYRIIAEASDEYIFKCIPGLYRISVYNCTILKHVYNQYKNIYNKDVVRPDNFPHFNVTSDNLSISSDNMNVSPDYPIVKLTIGDYVCRNISDNIVFAPYNNNLKLDIYELLVNNITGKYILIQFDIYYKYLENSYEFVKKYIFKSSKLFKNINYNDINNDNRFLIDNRYIIVTDNQYKLLESPYEDGRNYHNCFHVYRVSDIDEYTNYVYDNNKNNKRYFIMYGLLTNNNRIKVFVPIGAEKLFVLDDNNNRYDLTISKYDDWNFYNNIDPKYKYIFMEVNYHDYKSYNYNPNKQLLSVINNYYEQRLPLSFDNLDVNKYNYVKVFGADFYRLEFYSDMHHEFDTTSYLNIKDYKIPKDDYINIYVSEEETFNTNIIRVNSKDMITIDFNTPNVDRIRELIVTGDTDETVISIQSDGIIISTQPFNVNPQSFLDRRPIYVYPDICQMSNNVWVGCSGDVFFRPTKNNKLYYILLNNDNITTTQYHNILF